MAIEKVGSNKKKMLQLEKERKNKPNEVSLDDQLRLAEILNDSPRIVSLEGTMWEIRALRLGTQYLIAQKVLEITKAEEGSFGDILNHFAKSIPAVIEVLTLCLLNDRNKIFVDGDPMKGYSELYKATYNTLEWDCDVSQFGGILIETLQLLDVSFFFESLDTLEVFRQMTTAKKRMRIKEQK